MMAANVCNEIDALNLQLAADRKALAEIIRKLKANATKSDAKARKKVKTIAEAPATTTGDTTGDDAGADGDASAAGNAVV